jgi:hypothetical protein
MFKGSDEGDIESCRVGGWSVMVWRTKKQRWAFRIEHDLHGEEEVRGLPSKSVAMEKARAFSHAIEAHAAAATTAQDQDVTCAECNT